MKKRIVIYFVVFQLIVIGVIIFGIYEKKIQVLGTSINPIEKRDIMSSPSGELKYYYEPKPNTQRKEDLPGFNATYTINNDSLNDRYSYSSDKKLNSFRIIALGDSFTFGLYVNTKDNWTELLEDKLNTVICGGINKFEVINLGVRGYDNEYSVERYKSRGIKYHPDIILWLEVDMLRINELLKSRLEKLNDEASKSGLLKNDKEGGSYYEDYYKARKDVVDSLGEAVILEHQADYILRINKYFRGPVVLIPNPVMYKKHKTMLYNVAQKLNKGLYFDDLRNYYTVGAVFENDGHPNRKGHKMIAEDIFNYLNDAKLIPCN